MAGPLEVTVNPTRRLTPGEEAEIAWMRQNGVLPATGPREGGMMQMLGGILSDPVGAASSAYNAVTSDPIGVARGLLVDPVVDTANWWSDAVQGRVPLTDAQGRTSTDAIGRAMDIAGGVTGLGAAGSAGRGAGNVASMSGAKPRGLLDGNPDVSAILEPGKKQGPNGEIVWTRLGRVKHAPLQNMSYRADDLLGSMLPERVVAPENMMHGVLIPFRGDRARGGSVLRSVNGIEFNKPVILDAGADFKRSKAQMKDGSNWASGKSIISGILNNARNASEAYGGAPVYGMYSAMGHTAVDFNNMMAGAIAEQIKKTGGIDKDAARIFDATVKDQNAGELFVGADFPGINSPDLRSYLENTTGEKRTAFQKAVDRATVVDPKTGKKYNTKEVGFPDSAATRAAIIKPELLFAPEGVSGRAISRVNLDDPLVENPSIPHGTYPVQSRGEYIGGLADDIPRELAFPKFFADRRAEGIPPGGDRRSFEMKSFYQPIDQKWVDDVSNYLERKKRGLLND